jgi:hypothetical protein
MAKKWDWVFALMFVALVWVFIPGANAQTASTGALTGTVTDPSGAAIANVTVTVLNVGTGQSRTAKTGADGAYNLPLLQPGFYSVKFEATGFNTTEVPPIQINVTETAVLNHGLVVGSQSQQVVVTAESAEAVQTANATLGDVVSGTGATGLPLTTRNYTNLLGLSSGASAAVFNATTLGKGSTDIAVNGQSTGQNNVQMDGASVSNNAAANVITENGLNPGIGLVNPDAIQEFKIQTSLFDASYGRNPGASVNVVTKDGTNEIHGTLFEFFRNTDLNANDFFRNNSLPVDGVPTNSRQVLKQNQFGGVVGGPIKKDKLFYFVSYQGTRQINGAAAQGYSAPTLLPIPDTRTAAAVGAEFCPGGPDGGNSSTTTPFLAGVPVAQVKCDGSNINPVALAMLQYKNPDGSYFIPGIAGAVTNSKNQSTGTPTTFSIPARFREDQELGNLDYVIDSKNTLSARYFYTYDPTSVSFGCSTGGGAPSLCLPNTAVQNILGNHYGNLRLTTILSNNLVNEARFSIQRNTLFTSLLTQPTAPQFGITPNVPSIAALPAITVTGFFTVGAATNYPSNKAINNWEIADTLSWTHGKQTFRFGAELERDRYNWILAGLANGNGLTFGTIQDFLLGLPGCPPSDTAAQCIAAEAAGTANGSGSSNIASNGGDTAVVPPGGIVHGYRTPYGNAFVQDDIKIRPNFTLNVGLRWEYDSILYDSLGDVTNIWPSLINTVPIPGSTPATGTLAGFVVASNYNFNAWPLPPVGGVYQNTHKTPEQGNTPLTNFAPRLGFAWSPLANNRFVLRGGAGYFYDRVGQGNYDVSTTQGEPYATSDFGAGLGNYYSSFQAPWLPTSLGWTPRWVNFAGNGTGSQLGQIMMDPNWRTPLVYEWNLFTQYEFIHDWTIEVGYVGSRGIHQFDGRQINEAQLVGNPLGTNTLNAPGIAAGLVTSNSVANALLRVPYLGFAPGGMTDDQTQGDTKFNSLQATLRRRFSHGLQVEAAYTYSRAFNTVYSDNDPNVSVYQPNSAYHPQRLAINYLWTLPLGTHQGWMDKALSGWGVSGVTIVQDGTPLTPTNTTGGTIFGFGGAGTPVTSTAEYCPGMGAANVASAGSVQQRLGGRYSSTAWFNTSAVGCALPTLTGTTGTLWGNVPPGVILGPGQFNWDISLTKSTKVGGIREDGTLEFRTEFFNAFNHPQFSNPTTVDASKATFGQITSTSVNPRLIQFGLKYAF